MTWCQGSWISHKRQLNICQIFLEFSLGNVKPLCMPTPFVLLSPSACAVQNNLLRMKQILARYKKSRNVFLTLLKISLLLNYNNFQMLVVFSVLTSEPIIFFKYIIFYLREVLWSENCFDNYANVHKRKKKATAFIHHAGLCCINLSIQLLCTVWAMFLERQSMKTTSLHE